MTVRRVVFLGRFWLKDGSFLDVFNNSSNSKAVALSGKATHHSLGALFSLANSFVCFVLFVLGELGEKKKFRVLVCSVWGECPEGKGEGRRGCFGCCWFGEKFGERSSWTSQNGDVGSTTSTPSRKP